MIKTNYAKLKNFTFKIGSGITPTGGSASYKKQGIPLIRSQNVRFGRLDLDEVAYIDQEQHKKMSNSLVKPGDVLLNITGASIGRSCVVPDCIVEANVNQHVCIIRATKELNPSFLSHFFNSPIGQKQIWSFQSGGSREGLNYEQIASFKIPCMSINEQKAIAAILSTWDEAIEKMKQLIEIKERQLHLYQNNLMNVYTNKCLKTTLGSVAKIPEKKKLDDLNGEQLLTVKLHCKGIEANDRMQPKVSDTGRPYYSRKAGEILIGRQNFHNGGIGIVPQNLDGGIASNAITSIEGIPGKLDQKFLYWFLARNNYYQKIGHIMDGTGQKELSERQLLKLAINLPNYPRQIEISNILDMTKNGIDLYLKYLKMLRLQKQGLMQKLLTGKWRVNFKEEKQ